jgi:hypothetical protein
MNPRRRVRSILTIFSGMLHYPNRMLVLELNSWSSCAEKNFGGAWRKAEALVELFGPHEASHGGSQ